MCLLHLEIGDEYFVVVQTGFANGEKPLGQSLAVLQQKEVFVLHAAEKRNDVFDLFFEFVFAHLQLQLVVRIHCQQFLHGYC